MPDYAWITGLVLLGDVLLVVTFGLRAILARHTTGATLAWLMVLIAVPFAGAVLYLLLAERRIGRRRRAKAARLLSLYQGWQRGMAERSSTPEDAVPMGLRPIRRQLVSAAGMPAMGGNALELVDDAETALRGLIADVDAATQTVHICTYIWHPGGTADDVVAAVERAARRGVACRIIADAVGSKLFLRGPAPARLRAAGAEVVPALPVNVFRALFRRVDLRNHRKLAILDGEIAWTGSQNIVDPRYFKLDAGVGQWIDMSVRIRGPAVEALAGVFLADWELESTADARAEIGIEPAPIVGETVMQVLPSGPGYAPEALHQVLLTTIYSARERLILTTPYFVPDEAMLTALCSAAQRGVDVRIILPERVDSLLVRHASRAHYQDLLDAGVELLLFPDGLLHSKTITVDGELSLVGSVNLDVRSFWLNFELTVLVYDPAFTATVEDVQLAYGARSSRVDPDVWKRRPLRQRLVENTMQLLTPLL